MPVGVAYDAAKGEVFVANCGASCGRSGDTGSVSVINDTTDAVVASIPVGNTTQYATYDSGKGEVFATNFGSDDVSVISDSSNTVVASVPVGTGPSGVAYDAARGEVFVANSESESVSVISDGNNTVVATVAVPSPMAVAYDSAKGEVFVTNFDSATVSVISDTSDTLVATIPVGTKPIALAFDAAKGEMFVVSCGRNCGGTDSPNVTVVSDTTDAAVATVPAGDYPYGVAFDAAQGEAFVTVSGSNTTRVISDATDTVVAMVPTGSEPDGATYDSAKGEVFIANFGSNTVSVIPDTSYRVTFSTSPMTCGSITFDGTVYTTGESVQGPAGVDDVSATACTGYELNNLSGTGSVSVVNGQATVSGDGGVTATFVPAPMYNVTFTTTPSTCGSITFGGATYTNGETVQVTAGEDTVSATVCAGYTLKSLNGTGSVSVMNGQATVSGDGGVTAVFAPTQYLVSFTTSPLTCGSITFNGANYTNGGSVQVTAGSYSVSALPCTGYTLQRMEGTSSVTVNSGVAMVSGAGGITAIFIKSSPGFLGLPGNDGYYVVGGIVTVAVAAVAVIVLTRRRKGKPTGDPAPASSAAEPPHSKPA